MKRWFLLVCTVLLVGLTGLVAPQPTHAQVPHLVTIQNGAYSPDMLTIAVGDYIDWLNLDSTDHTATRDTGAWDTGTISSVQTINGVAVTHGSEDIYFITPGTYPYHDTFNAAMRGTIVVQAVNEPSASPTETAVSTATPSPTPLPTATAVPTATSAPTATVTTSPVPAPYPKPSTILTRASKAVLAAKTFHFVETFNGVFFGLTGWDGRSEGDMVVSTKQLAARAHLEGTFRVLGGGSQKSTADVMVFPLKGTVWEKSKATHGRWKRSHSQSAVPLGGMGEVDADPLFLAIGGRYEGMRLVTVGPDTYEGTGAWHVRATFPISNGQNGRIKIRADYLLNRDTSLPHSVSVFGEDRRNGSRIAGTVTLSGFGEPVVIKAPKAGSTSP